MFTQNLYFARLLVKLNNGFLLNLKLDNCVFMSAIKLIICLFKFSLWKNTNKLYLIKLEYIYKSCEIKSIQIDLMLPIRVKDKIKIISVKIIIIVKYLFQNISTKFCSITLLSIDLLRLTCKILIFSVEFKWDSQVIK